MKCSFSPYEGKEKYIFVSYSHQNSDVVAPILDRLNKEGFRIWYDEGIEWGTEWPESIAFHLRNCEVCIAFHSVASVVSPNCRQEINYALKQKKGILSVYLEDVALSDGLDMQLSPFQSTFSYQYEEKEKFLLRLISAQIIQSCKVGVIDSTFKVNNDSNGGIGLELYREETLSDGSITSEYSFDREINDKFREIFDSTEAEQNEKSTLLRKMEAIKGRTFISSLENRINKVDQSNNQLSFDDSISLVPIEYSNSSHLGLGKHFTIPDLPNVRTIIFEVYKEYDYKTLTKMYRCEALDFIKQSSCDEEETVYYIDDPNSNGNILVLLHFNSESNEVFINTGVAVNDEIRISKKPSLMKFTEIYFDDSFNLNSSLFNENEYYAEKGKVELCKIQKDTNEIWKETTISDATAIIVDPETAQQVRRETYFDEERKEWRAKIKIVPYKSYFAFQIIDEDNDKMALTDREIAKFYRKGIYGFPKDVLQAATYYEKDGSPQSLYEIATLFRSEKSIFDWDAYLEYLVQAVEMGSEEASIEYVIYLCQSNNADYIKKGVDLLCNEIVENLGIREFLLGYFIEIGVIDADIDTAYKHYLESAIDSYAPACVRLGHKKVNQEMIGLREYFMNTLTYGHTVADYCMGCVLFWGIGVEENKDEGLRIIKKASEDGNKMAIYALYEIYNGDSEFDNDELATECLQKIVKFDLSVSNKLANRLLDGIGCEVNNDNDKIAFEILQKYASTGDKTAMHNLGWLYKNGRGCSIDYKVARELFESAEKPNSFFWLGNIYENGLGVSIDMQKALEYYRIAAEKGSEKAINRLKEITI